MEKIKLDIEALRQKREMLQDQKKKRMTIAAAVCILLIVVIVLSCLMGVLNKGTINLEQVKKGTTSVIDKSKERKAVLNVYADDMSGSYNPAYAVSYGDQIVAHIVFEPLMKRDAKGELKPHLIKSLEVAEDGLTYTIKLKNDILFSDGSQLTVRDVMGSIAAMAVSGNGGVAAEAYERITGMSEFINQPVQFPEGLKEVSENELQIIFDEASPDNLLVMETLIQKGTFSEDMNDGQMVTEVLERVQNGIGTGAYSITDTSAGSLCTLIANENFREKIRDIKTVEFCSMSYYSVPEQVETGALDIAIYSGASQLYETFYGWEGFSVYLRPEETLYALYFNQDNAALKNEKVRQAIAYGFDRESDALEELSRYIAFDEGIALSTSAAKNTGNYQYDNGKAKKLLKEAAEEISELKDGLTLSLPIVQDNEIQKQLSEAVKADMQEIGITVEVQELSQQDYIQAIYLSRDFDLYLAGIPMNEDVSSLKEIYSAEGSLPITIDDARINTAYEELSKSYDLKTVEKERTELYAALQETAPILVLGRSTYFLSVSADLSDYEATPHEVLLDQIHKIQVKN